MAIPGNPVTVPGEFQQQLQMVPGVPRAHATLADEEPPLHLVQSDESAGPPTLETCSAQDAYQALDKLVTGQDRLARNRWAIDLYHRAVDDNFPFARLVYSKTPNQAVYEYRQPAGRSARESTAAVPNKANDLCNKVVDMMEADPAKPNPIPSQEGPAQRAALDIATQFLAQLGSATGIDDQSLWRWSLRNALTCGSSFIEYEVDPKGGGWHPLQVLADPTAQDPENPLVGTPQMDAMGNPLVAAPLGETADPILRYVSADNRFVETAAEADRVWLPGIRAIKLRREQVRTYPPTAKVQDAELVIVLRSCRLSEAIRRWPDTVGKMDEGQLKQLASFRTPYPFMVIDPAMLGTIEGNSGPPMSRVGTASPLLQKVMAWYRVYAPCSEEYPRGLMLDVSGSSGGTILGQETLTYEVTLPDGGTDERERDLPVIQETPVQDVRGGDPFGWPFESRFIGSSEATATLLAGYLDAIDQRLHPHIYLRSTATIDDEDMMDRSRPMILDPTDPEPVYEQFPTLPPVVEPVQFLYDQQNIAAGLGAAALALESEHTDSGVGKQIAIQQAHINLSGILQEHNGAKTRGWKVCLQLAQAYYKTPQLIRAVGDEDSGAARWWTGDDLSGVDDIGIQPGTGTMMTVEGKAAYLAYLQGQKWMEPQQAGAIARAGIARDIGLPKDPIESAVERAVDAWMQGPPDGWLEEAKRRQVQQVQLQQQQQAIQAQYQQQAQAAQAQGLQHPPQPQMPQLPPMVPQWSPFPQRANDIAPNVAQVWYEKLSALMMSPEYSAADPLWRQLVDQKFMTAIQTVIMVQQAGVIGGAPGAESYQQFVQKIFQRVVHDVGVDIGKVITEPLPSGQEAAAARGQGQAVASHANVQAQAAPGGMPGASQPFVMGA